MAQIQDKPKRGLLDYLGLAARGMAMGAADVVPGVSGGTMAFILGIYEELINSIRTIGRPEFLQAAVRLRFKEIFTLLNWKFLVAVFTGILTAFLSLARILEWLLINQPVFLWSFFFGLIVASVIAVSRRIETWVAPTVTLLVVGTVGAYFLVGLVPAQTPNSWWFLLISGAIASCSMILPGISGSFVLVLLGKYEYVLGSLNRMVDGLRAGDWDLMLTNMFTVGMVGIGAVVGLVSFAQLLSWLFKNYHDLTIAMLTGFMIGSLRKVWPWKEDVNFLMDANGQFVLSDGEKIVTEQINYLPTLAVEGGQEILIAAVLAAIAFTLVILLERFAGDGH